MINHSAGRQERFEHKVWVITSIVALTVIIIWIIKATFNVSLLILAAALIALFFRGLSGLIHRKLHIKEKWSLPLAIVGTLLVLAGFIMFAGNKISEQMNELSKTLPSTIATLKQEINRIPLGQQALQRLESRGGLSKLSSVAESFFRSSFGVIGDLYVVLFLAIFFTAGPRIYVNGFLKLVPPKGKPKAEYIIHQLGVNLTKWLKGKLFSMLVVAILTVIGLQIIDVPMAFVLALIAGILNFIPNFGPLIAMIPAVLIALMVSPMTALIVAGLYILIQVLESNFITPKIQQKLVSIPPALIIIAQLFMGVLTGGWGLVVATPIVLMLMIIIKKLYVDQMG